MGQAVFYFSFKLKKGKSVSDFLGAAEKLNNEFISKQKGFVSWTQLVDGDEWADMITFENMEDLKNFEAVSANPTELANDFYSYLNMNSCKVRRYTIEKIHN
jgi:hypothetical protein